MEAKGYVDMHAHILPGVDDGARTLQESIEMMNVAYEQGVRTIYATPHFGSGKEHYSKESLIEVFNQVKQEAKSIGNDGVELILGNELYYSHDILRALKEGEAFTMGSTRYVLVEFPYEIIYKELYNGLQMLINGGYRPILAHIERYTCLYKQFEYLYNLRELGVCLQVNTASVLPVISGEAMFCRKVIRQGLVQFLGSD